MNTNNQDKATAPDICSCGVPFEIHNTCCGWGNANTPIFPHEKVIAGITSDSEKKLRYHIFKSPDKDELARIAFPAIQVLGVGTAIQNVNDISAKPNEAYCIMQVDKMIKELWPQHSALRENWANVIELLKKL